MKNILAKCRNEIRSNSRVGEYEDLLNLIEKYIDELRSKSTNNQTNPLANVRG
jgi:hypothetical protein